MVRCARFRIPRHQILDTHGPTPFPRDRIAAGRRGGTPRSAGETVPVRYGAGAWERGRGRRSSFPASPFSAANWTGPVVDHSILIGIDVPFTSLDLGSVTV